MPLKILSYNDLYGWTMDAVVAQIGKKNNCTFCGVFRRQALDRGAAMLNVDHIVTGHNADDIAETVLMNSKYSIPSFLIDVCLALLQLCVGISLVWADALRYAHKAKTRSRGPNRLNTLTKRKL